MTEDVIGYVVEKHYDLWTAEEVEQHFGIKAQDSGLQWSTFQDECGNEVQGVAIEKADSRRSLRVINSVTVNRKEWLHHGQEQLRPHQAQELKALYLSDLKSCGTSPKVLFGKAGLTLQQMECAIREQQAKKAAEKEERERFAKSKDEEQPGDRAKAPGEEEVAAPANPHTLLSDSEDAEPDEADSTVPVLPSHRAKLAKEKEKKAKLQQKVNAKGKKVKDAAGKKDGKTRASSLQAISVRDVAAGSVLDAVPGTDSKESDTRSVASRATTGTAKGVTASKQLQKCDVKKLLAGHSIADKVYHLKRTIDSMEKEAKTAADHAEVNALRHHHEIATAAKDCVGS